jgi:hypothetical protein
VLMLASLTSSLPLRRWLLIQGPGQQSFDGVRSGLEAVLEPEIIEPLQKRFLEEHVTRGGSPWVRSAPLKCSACRPVHKARPRRPTLEEARTIIEYADDDVVLILELVV